MSRIESKTPGLRSERIKGSKQFAGGGFRNASGKGLGLKKGSTLSTVGEYFCGGQHRTPVKPLPSFDPLEQWTRRVESGLRATWLGHSTVLLEVDGRRVLTDPVWGERASPSSFAGPKRFQPVPVPIARLPPLDAVLISHDHYDHLCHESVLALAKLSVPFFTSLGVGARLEAWGVPASLITELDWWEFAEVGPLTITAAPAQHFSGRGLADRNRTLWSSFAVRGPTSAFFFSGDTGLTQEYREIHEKLGPFDLTMLEVGAFHPAWGDIHLGPENALEAHALLGGRALLPVHWGTFNLAIHDWDEPAETLIALAPKRDVQLVMPRLGEPIEPAHAERVTPWWREISALEKSQARREGSQGGEAPQAPEIEQPIGEPID